VGKEGGSGTGGRWGSSAGGKSASRCAECLFLQAEWRLAGARAPFYAMFALFYTGGEARGARRRHGGEAGDARCSGNCQRVILTSIVFKRDAARRRLRLADDAPISRQRADAD